MLVAHFIANAIFYVAYTGARPLLPMRPEATWTTMVWNEITGTYDSRPRRYLTLSSRRICVQSFAINILSNLDTEP